MIYRKSNHRFPKKAPLAKRIFVYGSSLTGSVKTGLAHDAYMHHGATAGHKAGISGQAYAIPVRDHNDKLLTLIQIDLWVSRFLVFAAEHRELQFDVTAVGCAPNEYTAQQIAPFFQVRTTNIRLPKSFINVLINPTPLQEL